MKTLERFNNVDKAELLFMLFPSEIPKLVQFIEGMAKSTIEDELRSRAKWKNGFFCFDLWLSWAKQANTKIESYGLKLHRHKRLFTDQLFDGHIACFTNHCIEVYITAQQHANKQFVHAVRMLYNI